MSDLKTVMERLAARFSPPDVGLEQVERYGRKLRRRQRLFAVALAVAVAAGGTTAAVWSFRSESSRFILHPATPTGPIPPDCPSPPSLHDPYAPVLDPASGPADSVVSVSGVISMLGEDRQYVPTSRIQVWWNVDPKLWYTVALPTPSPAEPGPGRLLGEVDVGSQCTYQVQVAIPAVIPGTYPLFGVFITPDGSSTNSSVMEFRVGPNGPPSPLPSSMADPGAIDWMDPLLEGIPTATAQEAETHVTLAVKEPPAVLGEPVGTAYSYFDPAHQGISWTSQDSNGHLYAVTEVTPTMTEEQLRALATCHAVETGCRARPASLVTLKGNTTGLLIDGTKVAPGHQAQATTLWWIANGIQFELMGPTDSFSAPEAIGAANEISSA